MTKVIAKYFLKPHIKNFYMGPEVCMDCTCHEKAFIEFREAAASGIKEVKKMVWNLICHALSYRKKKKASEAGFTQLSIQVVHRPVM